MDQKRYTVAQWATGHTGLHSLRKVIEHPSYDLVALRVYADEKTGRDAADIAGGDVAPAGVVATNDINDVIAARPDCVLYMPLLDRESIDDMCALLESGSNIVTTVPRFYHPPSIEPDVRAALQSACEKGGSSLYCTGPGPGWITLDLPLAISRLERRIDKLTILQYADLSSRQSPQFMRETFGMPLDRASESRQWSHTGHADGACLSQLAESLGYAIDNVTRTVEVAAARETVEIGVMTVEASTLGAWRIKVTGWRDGEPFMEFTRHQYVTQDVDPAWDLRDTCWHVELEGDTPCEFNFAWKKEGYAQYSPGVNANIAVNAVPAVCDAEPGIRTTNQLLLVPQMA